MNKSPTTKVICELLKRAQEHTDVLLTTDDRPRIVAMNDRSSAESRREARLEIERYLDNATWLSPSTDFQQLREWTEVHWNPDTEGPPPAGTVPAADEWLVQQEVQLDAVTAARKLISAAKVHGPERIGRHAGEFAAHGMIEVHWFWLLKGPPVEVAKPLDGYCTLLPYAEALQRIEAESDPGDMPTVWPKPDADSVCALQVREFERANSKTGDYRRYTSPLMKHGPDQLLLLLGLVWGTGFTRLGLFRDVPSAVASTLPYRLTREHATTTWAVSLPMSLHRPPPRRRPLAVEELHHLATSYSDLAGQNRSRVEGAILRLRSQSERYDDDDRAIDLATALATLFLEDGEQDRDTLVPQRAAWLYADSEEERRQTEDLLRCFFARHSAMELGRASQIGGDLTLKRNASQLADTEDVLRSCLKAMIAEEWPEDWGEAIARAPLRHDPPRPDSEIPSVKSDSLSWSVEEQREIDRALEAVWKSVVGEALPPPGMSATTVPQLAPEIVERYREQGIPYVVTHPARLYLAHPRWPKTPSEPLDERIMYYCERDIVRHIWQWRESALNKGLVQFEAPTDRRPLPPEGSLPLAATAAVVARRGRGC